MNDKKTSLETKTKVNIAEKISIGVILITSLILGSALVFNLILPYSQPTTEITIKSFNVTFSSNNYQISQLDKDGYQGILMDDFSNVEVPGEPALPKVAYPVVLPAGAKFHSFKIISSEKEDLPGNYKVEAAETPQYIGLSKDIEIEYPEVKEVLPKPEIYQSDTPYPQKIIETGKQGKMRKYDLIGFTFYPFQYLPKSGQLTLFKNIVVQVNYTQGPKPDTKILKDKVFDEEAKSLFRNFRQAEDNKWYEVKEPITQNTFFKEAKAQTQYNYVIIVPSSLISTVGAIKNYRQNQGYKVKIETTEYIYSAYSGADQPEKIRNYLIANYINWGIRHILLVGSITDIPLRYCKGSPNDFHTDYYFQDLTGNWDLNDYNCGFNLMNNLDAPEVYVGRVTINDPPPSDPNYASYYSDYFTRVINFENSTDTYKSKVLLAAGVWNYPNDAASQAEYLKDNIFLPNGYSVKRLYEETIGLSCTCPSNSCNCTGGSKGGCPSTISHNLDVSRDNIKNNWQNGIAFIAAHGCLHHFASSNCRQSSSGMDMIFSHADTPNLNNNRPNDYPAIVYGAACSTAQFNLKVCQNELWTVCTQDSDCGAKGPCIPSYDNIPNDLFKNGGVTYIGSSDLADTSDQLFKYYFKNLINEGQTSGQALALGRWKRSIQDYDLWEALNYNLYGEPLIKMPIYCYTGGCPSYTPYCNNTIHQCEKRCANGTWVGQCSAGGAYCKANFELVPSCLACGGCPFGYYCKKTSLYPLGTCVEQIPWCKDPYGCLDQKL